MAIKKSKQRVLPESEEELRLGLADFVAMSPDLDGVDVRVFIYLSNRLNFKEAVHVPQVQLAVELGRQQTHISRSLRSLLAAGVLLSGPDGTRGSKWMLNPEYSK